MVYKVVLKGLSTETQTKAEVHLFINLVHRRSTLYRVIEPEDE